MLGIDRKAARYTWTAAAVILLLCLVYLVRSTLFIFILAVLFAYLLSPLVNLLDRFLPSRTRAPALALAYVIFIGVLRLHRDSDRVAASSMQGEAFQQVSGCCCRNWEQPSPAARRRCNHLKAQIVDEPRAECRQRVRANSSRTLPKAGAEVHHASPAT